MDKTKKPFSRGMTLTWHNCNTVDFSGCILWYILLWNPKPPCMVWPTSSANLPNSLPPFKNDYNIYISDCYFHDLRSIYDNLHLEKYETNE